MKFYGYLTITILIIANVNYSDTSLRTKLRIGEGHNATQGTFPWHVSVLGVLGTETNILCGGSLITNEWVLTAANCVDGVPRFILGMGSILLHAPQVSMLSSFSIQHPKYNSTNFDNNVALIKLPAPVSLNNNIKTINLVQQDKINCTFINNKTTVSGFGQINDNKSVMSYLLKWANLRIISNEECHKIYDTYPISESLLCAEGYNNTKQNMCSGDTGGPLTMEDGGNISQVGISSFISGVGCLSGMPTGFLKISSVLSWIKDTANITDL